MIKVIVFFVIVAALAIGAGWLADRPGAVSLEWQGYVVEMELMTAIIIAIAVLALVIFLWSIFRAIMGTPKSVGRYMQGRKRDKGYAALSDGMIAVGSGEQAAAEKAVVAARKYLPKEPMTALLEAQTAQLGGDQKKAVAAFEGMAENDRTKLLGLHGLFLEAKRGRDVEAARQFAEKALAIAPTSRWAGSAMFEFQCASEDWEGALKTLQMQIDTKIVDKPTARRRRAVLLTALARDLEDGEPKKALTLANEAHGLDQSLVPCATLAARLMSRLGNIKKASKTIEETWRKAPHPELAAAYAAIRPGDSTKDRYKRTKSLAQKASHHIESKLAIAGAAIEAEQWAEARTILSQLAKTEPSVRVCQLMADLERNERDDAAKARAWLSEAVRAPRDPAWTADGVVSEEWLPTSPVTHRLDAFEWKVPVETLNENLVGFDEGLVAMIDAPPAPKSAPSARVAALASSKSELSKDSPSGEAKTDNQVAPANQATETPETSDSVNEPANDETEKRRFGMF